jgi:[acyl-carrier-protein] S-malonyltransferase
MAGYLLLCPGQGSQHPGMLDFALGTEAGRAALEEASDAAGFDVVRRVREGSDLFEPEMAQVGVVAASCATWRALSSAVPSPAAIAGYSVGEVSSWACSVAWPIGDTITLVRHRARLMTQANPPGAAMLAATGIDAATLEPHLGQDVQVAIAVDTGHWILAGPRPSLDAVAPHLAAAGATLRMLPVSVASHTHWLAAAARALADFVAQVPARDPQVPVVRGIDGRHLLRGDDAGPALCAAVDHTIRWDAVMDDAAERGWASALELPPGRALARIAGTRFPTAARAVEDFRSVDGVARWIERLDAGGEHRQH